jgi:thiol-disulfide isomerase/thioredoxin
MRLSASLHKALAVGLLVLAGSAWAQRGEVETIAPGDIDAFAAGTKGVLLLSLSSTDARCGYCVRHNARFKAVAHDRPDVGRHAQMLWEPWTAIPPPVAAFLQAHGKQPAVPAVIVFQDGRFDSIAMGELPNAAPVTPAPETGRVPQVAPSDIADTLAQSRGHVVVMLSSFETTCAFCRRANPGFETLAQSHPEVRFLRVMYRPWIASSTEPFGRSLEVKGLPVYLSYEDGRPVARVDGLETPEILDARLIGGR